MVVVSSHLPQGGDGPGDERSGQQGQQSPIDVTAHAHHALGVYTRFALKDQALAVRQDQTIPDEEGASIAIGAFPLMTSDQPRALRDQQVASAHCVEDVLGHHGHDRARPCRIHAVQQDRWNHGARLELKRGKRRRQHMTTIAGLHSLARRSPLASQRRGCLNVRGRASATLGFEEQT
ncbi:hypothetical protein D3C73_995590 [compost metagenome]